MSGMTDDRRFDALTKELAFAATRRQMLAGLISGWASAWGLERSGDVGAGTVPGSV